jgi:hypothetical protein
MITLAHVDRMHALSTEDNRVLFTRDASGGPFIVPVTVAAVTSAQWRSPFALRVLVLRRRNAVTVVVHQMLATALANQVRQLDLRSSILSTPVQNDCERLFDIKCARVN